jgi:hypothetical protein
MLPQQPNYISHITKHQQQAEHQPKQQTSQMQRKALTAMTMTTGYPCKMSAEEARKEQVRNPPENEHSKTISRKKQTTAQLG